MSDGSFREIQLTSKQVVFLFMAGLIAAVGIFLLGVNVGQRVSPDAAPTDATTADAGSAAPVAMPPATTPQPGELSAPNELQNRPAPVVTPPASGPAATATPAPTPTSTPTPAATTGQKPAATKPTPTLTPSGTHFVQTGSYGSRDNAQRQAAQLKARGHAAEMFVGSASDRTRYKVRIGPMAESAAKDLQARLRKEGLSPLLVRR